MVSEIILKKIEKKSAEKEIKEFVKDILDLERRHTLIHYPRYSEDYEKILSKHLSRMRK